MRIKECPTQQQLRNIFDYADGNLVYKNSTSSRTRANKVAGHKEKRGYVRVNVGGSKYPAHRLIYVWHFGYISTELEIDHINRVRHDNRIENLRVVTSSVNKRNTNFAGCSYHKTRKDWVSQIRVDNKYIYLGRYKNEVDAHNAYLEAKKIYHKIEIAKQRIEKLK